jgi:hypothetical protein
VPAHHLILVPLVNALQACGGDVRHARRRGRRKSQAASFRAVRPAARRQVQLNETRTPASSCHAWLPPQRRCQGEGGRAAGAPATPAHAPPPC